MKYLAVIASLVAMVAAEADPAGILWTHPNGIGFRSGVYGLGLNAHIPTGGYPHSHGLLVKREAEAEPLGYYGYGYAYPRYGLVNGPGYAGNTLSIHGPAHVLGKREANTDAGPYYRSPQGLSVPYYYHPYAYRGYYYG